MFCKNCGTPLDENAKFCPSCGVKVETEVKEESTYEDAFYYEEEKIKENAPEQFGYDDHLQEGKGADYQKSNFYGKKFEAQSVGRVGFGRPGAGSPIKKFLGTAFVFILIMVGYFVFFADSAPIYDLQLGVDIDSETYYPTQELDYVIESTGFVFVSYTVRDLEVGESITAKWYNDFTDANICTEYLQVDFEGESWFTECNHVWTSGTYRVDFLVDGEVMATKEFDVQSE